MQYENKNDNLQIIISLLTFLF